MLWGAVPDEFLPCAENPGARQINANHPGSSVHYSFELLV